MEGLDYVIIEDSADDLELILDGVKNRHKNLQYLVFNDGYEAELFFDQLIDNAEIALPKMILLDLKLPKVSGLDILKKIKENEIIRCIPTIIFTSSQSHADIDKSYNLGANAYIVKPIEFDEFISAVDNICSFWLNHNVSAC